MGPPLADSDPLFIFVDRINIIFDLDMVRLVAYSPFDPGSRVRTCTVVMELIKSASNLTKKIESAPR